MITYKSVQELVDNALEQNKTISELVLDDQAYQMECSREEVYDRMKRNFAAMKESIDSGLQSKGKSPSGLSGGDAAKLKQAREKGRTIGGSVLTGALVRAIAVAEHNACMGRIVAAPTAGSCGILPAALVTAMEEKGIPETKVVMSLFTAAGIGMVIAKRASISGAQGGCQAECGAASAMAAAALAEVMDGSPCMVSHACAIALENVLGLVCDPVAGLVEVPCIKRNASGAANALVAAELAFAGIESAIPADEVIDAMKSIGDLLPSTLRETAKGGLADTPTGRRLAERISPEIFEKKKSAF